MTDGCSTRAERSVGALAAAMEVRAGGYLPTMPDRDASGRRMEPSGSGNGFFQEKTVAMPGEFEMDAADAGSGG